MQSSCAGSEKTPVQQSHQQDECEDKRHMQSDSTSVPMNLIDRMKHLAFVPTEPVRPDVDYVPTEPVHPDVDAWTNHHAIYPQPAFPQPYVTTVVLPYSYELAAAAACEMAAAQLHAQARAAAAMEQQAATLQVDSAACGMAAAHLQAATLHLTKAGGM